MASIETLIGQIADGELRDLLVREFASLKKRLDWGLVFERHLPENTRLLTGPVRIGTLVWERRAIEPRRFRVESVDGSDLLVVLEPTGAYAGPAAERQRIPRTDVLIEQDFAEPVFPSLIPLTSIRRGADDQASHAIIEGENYHALEMLLAVYEGRVDCLYLDPPYNTGAHDWSYNNDYVDPNDQYRPSKWLAFMERRLRLGRRLLKDDGVILITIDEHEVHHLGMLLEQMFPEARIQMGSIVINPSGTSEDGLSRVDEYVVFCFFGGAQPAKTVDDFLGPEHKSQSTWESLLRRGSGWTRELRRNLCYPVLIDTEGRVAGVGERLEDEDADAPPTKLGEFDLAWPIRSDGRLGIWRVDPARLRMLSALGYAYATRRDEVRGTWSIKYLLEGAINAIEKGDIEIIGRGPKGEVVLRSRVQNKTIAKTVWHRGRHTAGGNGGTQLLTALLGRRGVFSYPKSLYAVRDAIDVAVGDRRDALIIDFFAGSGTTLHAVLLLNAEDDGRRRCVLVTNNEVNYQTAATLNRNGHFRGDPEFEGAGVFEVACRPRIMAALSGRRPDGAPVAGRYLEPDGREYSEGFAENVEFFRLTYLDPVEIELGLRMPELHPLLWLAAGGIGERQPIDLTARFALPTGSPYAILFDPSGLRGLLAGLVDRPDVTHVFIAADSDQSFEDLARALPEALHKVALFRDYLETLRSARA
jgi:adenine-specific DNA-methyltransferase